MIWPRWLARLMALMGGYFWIQCPVCREHFAGFEAPPAGHNVNNRVENGEYVSEITCSKPECMAEGDRQQRAFFERVRGDLRP